MMATEERPTGLNIRSDRNSPCAFAAEGLCDGGDRIDGRCEACERYNDLLQQARDLYRDVRWIVTPDGLLEEIR
jgi:hypothetical protein